MKGRAIRGGRAASDRLLADLLVIRDLAREGKGAILRNPLLVGDRLDDIELVIQGLEHFINGDLEKLLRRRDETDRGELDMLRSQLDEVRARMDAFERGSAMPIPLRKQERG